LTSYGYKTISRNTDWYDSYTLFTADVNVSKNSAKANEIAGEYIMQRASQCKDKATRDSLFRRSIAYQQKAILVYPKQIVALINLAACYYEYNKDYDTILVVYKTILKYLPDCPQVYTVFNSMMAKYDNIDHKISLYENLLEANPERYDVNMNLGVLNLGGKQDATKALPYLEKAVSLNPGDFDGHKYLGTAYSYLRRWDDARIQLEIAEKIRPGDGELNKNLAAVYQNLGDFQKAKQIMERTNRMQQQKSVN